MRQPITSVTVAILSARLNIPLLLQTWNRRRHRMTGRRRRHLLADYGANGSAPITHLRECDIREYPLLIQRCSATASSVVSYGKNQGCARRNSGSSQGSNWCATYGRIGRRSAVSSAGGTRNKACAPTPDGRVGRVPWQATGRHRERRAVPGGKSLPSCRSAATATNAGCLPIAIPGFADPSPVPSVRYAWQLDSRRPVPDFLTNPFCGEGNHIRCDLLHRGSRRPTVEIPP